MLKYQINKNGLISDKQKIEYTFFDTEPIDYDETKVLVTCYYNDEMEIRKGNSIVAVYNENDFTGYRRYTTKTKFQEYEITGVDLDERYFTFVADKYNKLNGLYMAVNTVTTYEDEIITVEEYEAKSETEQKDYSPNTYAWKYANVITNAEFEAFENGSGSNDYAFSSYVDCYTNGTDYISAWAYYGLDAEEKTTFHPYGGHKVLSPYVSYELTAEEYERLFDYEKECYEVISYVKANGLKIDTDYLYVYFENDHYFRTESFIQPYVFIDCVALDGTNVTEELKEGEVVDEQCLRFLYGEDEERIYNEVLAGSVNEYLFEGSMYEYDPQEGKDVVRDDMEEYVTATMNAFVVAKLNNVDVYRYNIMFATDAYATELGVSLYLRKHMTTISIPLSNMFSTDTYHEYAIKEKFVDVETKKAINDFAEMERDVYHPVCFKTENQTTGRLEYDKVRELRFNLHFRQHEGNEWLVDPKVFWNGTIVKDDVLQLMNPAYSSVNGFYSFSEIDKQSDLLSYLDFTNNDIKYQKNVLKKSFLRLSFYDSMKPTDQNLLCYSTIFINSGDLFGKYTRNFTKGDDGSFQYTALTDEKDANGDYITRVGLGGVRVDREPIVTTGTGFKHDESVEKYRLSSRFSVRDKYSSDSSSDGFYLYLWKDNDLGFYPTDIYMKVEFNHAGFGRVIPFMMPYDRERKRLKSFSDIVADWNDGGYGIREYLRYSYIHFKYRYDKKEKKHIYYMDTDQYGSIELDDGGVLNINLWEAKVN